MQLNSGVSWQHTPVEVKMYVGPPLDDPAILERLPAPYRDLLGRANGYVAYNGGLHVRGACVAPEWHSLRAAWDSVHALHHLFPELTPDDIPFAEDALGDQYIIRAEVVHRMAGETGQLESLGVDFVDFDAAVRADPIAYLNLAPLEAFRAQGGTLTPGQLLNVYPPYVSKESAAGVSFRAIAAADRIGFLASLAAQLRGIADGTAVRFVVNPPAS